MAKKRSNHEGNIRYIPSKKLYEARLTLHGVSKSQYAKTREEASNKLDDMKMSKRQGLGLTSKDMKLKELVEIWLDSRKQHWDTKTLSGYETPIKKHILPILENKKISYINNPVFLDDFFNKTLIKKGLTAHTIGRCHRALSNCFKWGVGRNLLSFNKCVGGVKGYFRLPLHTPRVLPQVSIDQVTILAKEFDSVELSTSKVINKYMPNQFPTLLKLLLSSGLRISEALGLAEEDIDFDRNTITVRHQLKYEDKVFFLDKTKTRVVRTIPLDDRIVNSLLTQLAERDTLEGGVKVEHDSSYTTTYNPYLSCSCCSTSRFKLLFVSEHGTPIDKDNLRKRMWYKLMRETSLDINLRLHDLRHLFASISLAKGIDVVTVSKLMGHANPSITLKVYAQYIETPNADEVAIAMGNLIYED